MDFKPSAARVKKARLRKSLKPNESRNLLWAAVVILVALAIAGLTVFHLAILALCLVPAGPIIMLLAWYDGELAELLPEKPLNMTSSVVDVLEPDLLASLKPNPSPKDLAEAIGDTIGGRFYLGRYLIAINYLSGHLSDNPNDTPAIMEMAKDLAISRGRKSLDDVAIAAALIMNIPNVEGLLASLNLDTTDIPSGFDWYIHIENLLETIRNRPTGLGIARNLTFGYTPILDQIGRNISEEIKRNGSLRREIEGHESILDSSIGLLSSASHRNITLVGDVGSGKTSLVYGLADRLQNDRSIPASLKYNQIFELDAATLISNARGRGELEQMVAMVVNETVKSKNTILFLDDANLFLEDGNGSVDLTNILLPVIQNSGARLILAMTDAWWQRLSQVNPGLTQILNRVAVKPLGRKETLMVAEDQVILLEWQHKVTYTYQAIQTAYDLASRFINDQVFPGKIITVLEAAANQAKDGLVSVETVQQAVEQRFGVKIQSVNKQSERDTLLNMEDKIHKRMINQKRAVKVVSDALRRARSGVRNTKKPIGTFLFLGPTGVGKTELAKSLASVYFGGEDRLVRVDLNEYGESSDAKRLIDTAANNPNSLCALISKQPFSVVLLDEIEKAHDSVLNMLLQMLDEGILRDVNNREVNFREAIIIATSNAGADQIRSHISQGQALEDFEESFVNELIDSHIFRPEFINRFDEIVLFRPLTKDELIKIVDLNLVQINKSLASQKVTVVLSDEAKAWLAESGYDPRLGARPLRRTIQRTVENVVAQKVLAREVQPGGTITLDLPDLTNERTDAK